MTQPKETAFVQACAWGDIDTIHRLLNEGVDVNGFDESEPKITGLDNDDDLNNIEVQRQKIALGDIRPTTGMTGVGAAMSYHQMGVLDCLKTHDLDFFHALKSYANANDVIVTNAIDVGIKKGFSQGVDKLITEHGLPLWSRTDRPATDLLFMALPRASSIHCFGPGNNPKDIENARRLDAIKIQNGLETIDYLVKQHGLDINAFNERGNPLLMSADSFSFGFWGNNGRTVEHLLKLGCNPNQETIVTDIKQLDIAFTQEAEKDLQTVRGNLNAVSSFHDLFKTTPLIRAAYEGEDDLVALYLKDDRTDPLYQDRHGNTAISAVERGIEFNLETRVAARIAGERYQRIQTLLTEATETKRAVTPLFSTHRQLKRYPA